MDRQAIVNSLLLEAIKSKSYLIEAGKPVKDRFSKALCKSIPDLFSVVIKEFELTLKSVGAIWNNLEAVVRGRILELERSPMYIPKFLTGSYDILKLAVCQADSRIKEAISTGLRRLDLYRNLLDEWVQYKNDCLTYAREKQIWDVNEIKKSIPEPPQLVDLVKTISAMKVEWLKEDTAEELVDTEMKTEIEGEDLEFLMTLWNKKFGVFVSTYLLKRLHKLRDIVPQKEIEEELDDYKGEFKGIFIDNDKNTMNLDECKTTAVLGLVIYSVFLENVEALVRYEFSSGKLLMDIAQSYKGNDLEEFLTSVHAIASPEVKKAFSKYLDTPMQKSVFSPKGFRVVKWNGDVIDRNRIMQKI